MSGRRRDIGDLVDAVERSLTDGDEQAAVSMLVAAEGRAFLDSREYVAGELAYTRFEIERGDVPGAVAVLRALAERRRP